MLSSKRRYTPFAIVGIVTLSTYLWATSDSTPILTIKWVGEGGGLMCCGASGDSIYGVSGPPNTLETWRWQKNLLKRRSDVRLPPGVQNTAWLGENTLAWVDGPHRESIMISNVSMQLPSHRHTSKDYFCCSRIESSGNGRYVVATFGEDVSRGHPDFENLKTRICFIDQEGKASWLPDWVPTKGGFPLVMAIPSNDGTRVAVVGKASPFRLTMVDVASSNTLWDIYVKHAVGLADVAFSPDARHLFVGGGQGRIRRFDVTSGKELDGWFATDSGEREYGQRISVIAVSADGRFVAAGTGPEGRTYIHWADSGKPAKIVVHGAGSIAVLSFSPDSTRLATYSRGWIKIWGLPSK